MPNLFYFLILLFFINISCVFYNKKTLQNENFCPLLKTKKNKFLIHSYLKIQENKFKYIPNEIKQLIDKFLFYNLPEIVDIKYKFSPKFLIGTISFEADIYNICLPKKEHIKKTILVKKIPLDYFSVSSKDKLFILNSNYKIINEYDVSFPKTIKVRFNNLYTNNDFFYINDNIIYFDFKINEYKYLLKNKEVDYIKIGNEILLRKNCYSVNETYIAFNNPINFNEFFIYEIDCFNKIVNDKIIILAEKLNFINKFLILPIVFTKNNCFIYTGPQESHIYIFNKENNSQINYDNKQNELSNIIINDYEKDIVLLIYKEFDSLLNTIYHFKLVDFSNPNIPKIKGNFYLSQKKYKYEIFEGIVKFISPYVFCCIFNKGEIGDFMIIIDIKENKELAFFKLSK